MLVLNDSLHICIIASWSSWSALSSTVLAGADAGTATDDCCAESAAEQHCVQPKNKAIARATYNFVEDIILISLKKTSTSHKISMFLITFFNTTAWTTVNGLLAEWVSVMLYLYDVHWLHLQ